MDIYNDREKKEDYPGVDPYLIINSLRNGDYISEEEVSKLLVHKNAVICFLSSKDIYFLMDKYKKLLEG